MSGDGPPRARAPSLVLASSHLHTDGHPPQLQPQPNGEPTASHDSSPELSQLELELSTQQAVAEGAANLLSRLALADPNTAELRDQVQAELDSASQRIHQLRQEISRLTGIQAIFMSE